ncbi:MAG: ABC transporter ATP-binding protein [Candidatus Sungbacteria bacterium]|uniref:ABC transporter ATP-binding protein n=1 Tax=Candidatus Sungiibacteriota bacterium TaxID=2750080 RepID=A0A9D6LRS8_9BACT|nr:ABC transporter ATP-binding protein [Candidatus Sungbacteria bacterium]
MLEISRVEKAYEGRNVVDDLSLAIKKGTVFGFLGPNGAGKTTTIKMIVGLSRPDAGTIRLEGRTPQDPAMRAMIGFMPEAPYFYEYLTGLEFLKFCDSLFPEIDRKPDAVYTKTLAEVGILNAANRLIRTYSKGMRQRLGFAQAVIHDPDYIFLDEPLDGLDPIGRRELKEIIKTLKSRGKTIFFNSHILFDTEELCDEIGIIHQGRLLYSGPIGHFTKGKSLEERFVETVKAASPAKA